QIDQRPPSQALSEATIDITVRDAETSAPLPCRVTIVDSKQHLAAIVRLSSSPLAVRPGVVYTGCGKARIGLPPGEYTLLASRGFEYSLATQSVSAAEGAAKDVAMQLRHEVPTPGLASCDAHVHTFTHAKHGDATIEERMLTLAGEGIELPISTEHNMLVDFTDPAQKAGVHDFFTSVVGCEVTTK